MGDLNEKIEDSIIKEDEIKLDEKLSDVTKALRDSINLINSESSEPPEILPKILSHITNLLFLNYDSIKSSSLYNIWISLLWMFFSVGIYTISFGIEASHVVFTIYCCSVWLMAIAIIFLFNLKNKI